MNTPHGEHPVIADASMSIDEAKRFAITVTPICAAVTVIPYVLLWGFPDFNVVIRENQPDPLLLLLAPVVMLASIVVHELLHAVGFMLAGRVAWRDVRFGVHWRQFTPYAHTSQPMKATAYRISVVLPAVVLGIIPAAFGLAEGSFLLTLYAFIMLVAAGGDMAVLKAIASLPGKALVRDHPERAGCLVIGEMERGT